jgi:3-oxoacyl-[acyl-carrier protein] reductase
MNSELQGHAALVTGAGRGIGASIARELSSRGAAVALVDLGQFEAAEVLAAELRAIGRQALALRADVASFADADASVKAAAQAFGRLDLLVCNAGITRDAASWKMTEADWDAVIAVNLKGCFSFCRAVAPIFRAQKSGRIVTIASINGLRGKFGQANYSASKAGIIGLTRSLARELGPSGVTVNCIAPGMIRSDMTDALPPQVLDKAVEESAVGHIGEPADVAHAVAFFCSPHARHITGQVLAVDGGQCM